MNYLSREMTMRYLKLKFQKNIINDNIYEENIDLDKYSRYKIKQNNISD